MTDKAYDILVENHMVNAYRDYLDKGNFDDLMIELLIIKEESGGYFEPGLLLLLKTIKSKTGFGLKNCMDFLKMMRALEIIDGDKGYISDYVYVIGSMKDILYMVDNRMDIKQFSRYQKLIKLKSNINNKV